jgi:hypothetical protein
MDKLKKMLGSRHMKKVCGLCGGKYTGRRKLEHIKRHHKKEAYESFIENHIKNKICGVCKNTIPFIEDIKQHVMAKKHLPKAAKELAHTF